jgi:hypothetical protein
MVDVAQLVRALDCGSRCRGFESHLPPETKNRYLKRHPRCFLFQRLINEVPEGIIHYIHMVIKGIDIGK